MTSPFRTDFDRQASTFSKNEPGLIADKDERIRLMILAAAPLLAIFVTLTLAASAYLEPGKMPTYSLTVFGAFLFCSGFVFSRYFVFTLHSVIISISIVLVLIPIFVGLALLVASDRYQTSLYGAILGSTAWFLAILYRSLVEAMYRVRMGGYTAGGPDFVSREIMRLLYTIDIDVNTSSQFSTSQRTQYSASLEMMAYALERGSRGSAVGYRVRSSVLDDRLLGAARHIRSLVVWTLVPQASTRADLRAELLQIYCCIFTGYLHHLPYKSETQRSLKTAGWVRNLRLLAGSLMPAVVLYISDKLGFLPAGIREWLLPAAVLTFILGVLTVTAPRVVTLIQDALARVKS